MMLSTVIVAIILPVLFFRICEVVVGQFFCLFYDFPPSDPTRRICEDAFLSSAVLYKQTKTIRLRRSVQMVRSRTQAHKYETSKAQ
jgi:hypothetical protein